MFLPELNGSSPADRKTEDPGQTHCLTRVGLCSGALLFRFVRKGGLFMMAPRGLEHSYTKAPAEESGTAAHYAGWLAGDRYRSGCSVSA